MRIIFKILKILFLLIALPLVAFVAYIAFTMSSKSDASPFAQKALGQIAQTLDTQTFLSMAAPRYEVSLQQPASAAEAQSSASNRSLVVMAGGTPELVKQTFDRARQELGGFKEGGNATCTETMGLIMCFGGYTYERSSVLLFATLQKAEGGYKIQELKIAPIK